MELKDFVKDVALKLNKNNVDEYRAKAVELINNDIDGMTGDELASLINIHSRYAQVLNVFGGDTSKMLKSVKRFMQETHYALQCISEMIDKHPEVYEYSNQDSKTSFLKKGTFDASKVSTKMFKDWLDINDNKLWTENNLNNPLIAHLDNGISKEHITLMVNHPYFGAFISHYALKNLLIDHEDLLDQKTFDKVLRKLLNIIHSQKGWNTNFSKEFAPLVTKKWFKESHFELFSNAQLEGMRKLGLDLADTLTVELKQLLYSKFGDDEFLSKTIKDIFIF